ncbi:30S ribosomal protein S6 [Spiroplasma sp. JKS002669]|uniref:30S ribosomal protein S6 n=1 Tax=Spiroplasma attinicola TaxID=2904537 RepID=UPI002022B7FA|nr:MULTISPECIES: 30S ribosomal protein S6 [unclassified Spiroplasma]MCL6428802.1 30S ribosomal protein S6 [Spiroplasma sp. JKS002669]MCL8210204.1 30S ribosomal protein S6 [Spiroplasma sp. JKS002670]MCL8210711.1 30S ribosomal protein S6 [Spiroplasma sp. JKS002671]
MVETKFNNYEIMYIVDDQNPEKANSVKKEFLEILTKNDGKLVEEKDFVQQFAYKINHKDKGHYFVLKLKTTAQNIADFSRIFSIKQKQGEVIRKLIINLDDEKINTFKVRKENPKKPEFNREHNHDSRVRFLDSNRTTRPESEKAKITITKSNKTEDTKVTSETKKSKTSEAK